MSFEQRLAGEHQRITGLTDALTEKEQELQQYVTDRKAEIDAAVSEAQTKVNEARTSIESAITSQADDFRSAQEERAQKFNEASDAREKRLDELAADAETRTTAVVEAAEQAMEKATSAEGALGLTGTAERYREEADKQRTAANVWRWITVTVVALAALVGIWAASTEAGDTETLIGRLAIGVALGALAAYTAKQSGRHRDREEDTREIAMDLAAFNSFIEPLSEPKDKDDDRRELGKRIFGQQLAARNRTKAPGPGLIDQIAAKVAERLRRSPVPDEVPPDGEA